jgi:hypothetical protein
MLFWELCVHTVWIYVTCFWFLHIFL